MKYKICINNGLQDRSGSDHGSWEPARKQDTAMMLS